MFPLLLLFFVLFGILGSGLLMFWWAASSGQFEELERGSRVIFDAKEPIGQATDTFPKKKLRII
jgi:cbb3-type cytochrome oxidase maturation protein